MTQENLLFNRMADYYDSYRPGYPREIVDVIIDRAGLRPGSKLLEIGAGSGKATAQFADRGFQIICIEPGADLAEKGRKNFQGKDVHFVTQRFEEYDAAPGTFDAIISAQAFHWVTQPLGYEKCAFALKDKGILAPFWNIDLIKDTEADLEFYDLLDHYNAFTACMRERDYPGRVESISSAIADSGYFGKPQIVQVYWEKTYTAEEYFYYALTGQVFLQNSDTQKSACYNALQDFAQRHGGIHRRYVCELYLSEKL